MKMLKTGAPGSHSPFRQMGFDVAGPKTRGSSRQPPEGPAEIRNDGEQRRAGICRTSLELARRIARVCARANIPVTSRLDDADGIVPARRRPGSEIEISDTRRYSLETAGAVSMPSSGPRSPTLKRRNRRGVPHRQEIFRFCDRAPLSYGLQPCLTLARHGLQEEGRRDISVTEQDAAITVFFFLVPARISSSSSS